MKINSQIELDPVKFEISTELKHLDIDTVRSAVSSFGGGTNAHVVMESYTGKRKVVEANIILLSAKTESSLRITAIVGRNLKDYKGEINTLSLSTMKRPHFAEKRYLHLP